VTTRRRRRVVTLLSWLLPAQLLVGGVLVLHAQPELLPNTRIEQKLTDDVVSIREQLKKIDDLHLEGRLAVLDALSERSWRIELLVIGLLLTTAGHLALQAWMHKSRGEHRHGRFDDEAED
jgi:hypothetical protein